MSYEPGTHIDLSHIGSRPAVSKKKLFSPATPHFTHEIAVGTHFTAQLKDGKIALVRQIEVLAI